MAIVFTFNSPKCYLRDKKCEKRSEELYRLGKVNTLIIVDPNKVFNSFIGEFKKIVIVSSSYWTSLETNVCNT